MTWYKEAGEHSDLTTEDHEAAHQGEIQALRTYMIGSLPLDSTHSFNQMIHLRRAHGIDRSQIAEILADISSGLDEDKISPRLQALHDTLDHSYLSHAHDHDPADSHIVQIADRLKEIDSHIEEHNRNSKILKIFNQNYFSP